MALDVSMDELLGHPESTAHQTTRTVTDHAVSASPGRECADWMPADGGLLALLPHEDPKQLEDRIQQWITDMQPRNAVERDLVCHAARLAHRVRQAARTQTQKVSARRLKKVRDLGRKLLYIAGPGTDSSPGPPWDDEPAVFVARARRSAEGCHWLLERWAEFRNLLDRKAGWSWPEMFRFIRLQGKHSIEAVYDPGLNSIFLAWEVLFPKSGHGFWNPCKNRMASDDPAHNSLLVWPEIAPRPRDKTEAWPCSARSWITTSAGSRSFWPSTRKSRKRRPPSGATARRRFQPGIRGPPSVPVHPDPRAAPDAGHSSKNAECGTGNGEGEMADDKWGGFAGSEPGQLRGVRPKRVTN